MSNDVDPRVSYGQIGGIPWRMFSSLNTMGQVKIKGVALFIQREYMASKSVSIWFFLCVHMTWAKEN